MTSREDVNRIIDGGSVRRIPILLNALSLPLSEYGYTMPEVIANPEKMVEAIVGTRIKYGYDGLCAGVFNGVQKIMGGHLAYADGRVLGDGHAVINSPERIGLLVPYSTKEDVNLLRFEKIISNFHKIAPDQASFAIVLSPSYVAFNMLGAKRAYKTLVKTPDVFVKLENAVEEAVVESSKRLVEFGIDFLWFPMPYFGAACISRDIYKNYINHSNERTFRRIKEFGARIVIHTCGRFDDRFDLVVKEHGDAWHVSDTRVSHVQKEYGNQVALMGGVPCCDCLLDMDSEQVYDFVYQECLEDALNGNFLLSADCDVSPLTSENNLRAMIRAARDAEKVLFE